MAQPSMRAMLFEGSHKPLHLTTVARPEPGPGQVLIKVHACGVCRTDLHLVDGGTATTLSRTSAIASRSAATIPMRRQRRCYAPA